MVSYIDGYEQRTASILIVSLKQWIKVKYFKEIWDVCISNKGDSGVKVSILGGDSIGHCEK
jgi:hypothetical protein